VAELNMSGTSSSNITIASSGSASSYTLYQALPFTNINNVTIENVDFLNNGDSIGGGLVLTDNAQGSAFEITSLTSGTTTTYYASLGGRILNFEPGKYPGILGDQITIQALPNLLAQLFQGGTANADYKSLISDLDEAAESGGQIEILPSGTVDALSFVNPFMLDLAQDHAIEKIGAALFGTAAAAAGATLDFSFGLVQNPNNNTKVLDTFLTTNAAINPCFAAGTRILTVHGEIPVEDLTPGMLLINQQGEEQEITWIGRRAIDIAFHPRPETVRPIIFEAGALADGVPARRLVLSPDHALLLDGVLVPAKELLNWTNIRPDPAATKITYYHIELARHDIIFAEAAPCESYLDTGHRGVFDNAEPSPVIAHPALMQQRRATESCAPLCLAGPALAAIRQRIASRQVGIRLKS